VRIGLLLPPEEAEATSVRQGAQLGIDDANRIDATSHAELHVRGRLGQWGADADEAANLVFDDRCRALIAPPGGAASHLVQQISGRTATPVVSLSSGSSVVGAEIPWAVRIVPALQDEARMVFERRQDLRADGPPRWLAFVPGERAGRQMTADLVKAATTARIVLIQVLQIGTNAAELAALVQGALDSRPDAAWLGLDPEGAGRLAAALRAAGFMGLLAGSGRLETAAFTDAAGAAAEGTVVAAPRLDSATRADMDRFTVAYRTRFGVKPDQTAAMAYDAARLLVDGLRRLGGAPARTMFPLGTPWHGVTGGVRFDLVGRRLVELEIRALASAKSGAAADR
jgi:ABC-type branched-subunit amino acid transport system substrate-binding protein